MSAAPPPPADSRLQIVRALAALLVLADHARLSIPDGGRTDYREVFNGFFGHLGALGVALFFALSGYLMLTTNRERFGEPGASATFLLRRLLRIAPLYYAASAAAALALWARGAGLSPQALAKSLLFWPFYGDIEHPGFYPVLGVGWTLNLEMAFYALFALALALPRRYGVALVLATIVAGVALGHALAARAGGPSLAGFYAQPAVLLFAFGVALAALSPRPRRAPLGAVFALTLALLAGLDAAGVAPGRVSLVAAAGAAPLLAAAVMAPPRPERSRLGAALGAVGDGSYSLYLFHTPLLMATNPLAAALGLPVALAFAFNFVAAGALAWLAYPLLERPLRRRWEAPVRRWLGRVRPGQFALLTLRR